MSQYGPVTRTRYTTSIPGPQGPQGAPGSSAAVVMSTYAKGDGSDQTVQMQQAVNAAIGKELYVDEGTFATSAPLVVDPTTRITGAGNTVSILQFTGAGAGIVWANGSPYGQGGVIYGITVESTNAASTDGITCTLLSQAVVERCILRGWKQRAVFFSNCILAVFKESTTLGCGGASYAQVEVDGGTEGTTFTWDKGYISGQNIAGNVVAGLRIDRTSYKISGGAVESTGTLIQIGSKTEGTYSCTGSIRDIDLENPNNGAEAYIEMGYGWTGTAGYGVIAPVIENANCNPSGSLTVAKPIKLANTLAAKIDHNNLVTSEPTSATTWAASTVYAANHFVNPITANGYYFEATTVVGAGESGSSEPAWNATVGATTNDYHTASTNGVIWTCVGKIPLCQVWLEGTTNISTRVGINTPPGGGQAVLPAIMVNGVAPSFGDTNIGISQPWALNGPSIPGLASVSGATPTVASAQGQIGVFWTGNGSTTHITNIGGGLAPGQTLVLWGTDSNTWLNHAAGGSGQIFLVDGNNIQLTAGKSVLLVLQSSGNWYQPEGSYRTAGGSLGGSYPNPTVAQIDGTANVCPVKCTMEPDDDSWDCGIPGNRWHQIYCRNGLYGGTSLAAGNAVNMPIQAESAKAGSNGDGGNVVLQPGLKDGSGTNGVVEFENVTTAASASVGGTTVPATCSAFLVVNIGGTLYKIPYYPV